MKELSFCNLKYDEKEGVRNLQRILKEAEQAGVLLLAVVATLLFYSRWRTEL
jgi:hypothetical protein